MWGGVGIGRVGWSKAVGAGLGPMNTGADPCHGQQLPSTCVSLLWPWKKDYA